MNRDTQLKAIAVLVGTSFAAGAAVPAAADTGANPFAAQDLPQGYQLMSRAENEGKWGEGKCGGDAAAKAEGEGKCGEGKCGGDAAAKAEGEGKCGEGKCGGSATAKAEGEGKCGEGKCGA
jgi:uncharacterized low-complexity protein